MKLLSFVFLIIGIFLMMFFNSSYDTQYTSYKTLKSQSQSKELKESIKRGNTVYSDFCVSCHLPNGNGVNKIYPANIISNIKLASVSPCWAGKRGAIN